VTGVASSGTAATGSIDLFLLGCLSRGAFLTLCGGGECRSRLRLRAVWLTAFSTGASSTTTVMWCLLEDPVCRVPSPGLASA